MIPDDPHAIYVNTPPARPPPPASCRPIREHSASPLHMRRSPSSSNSRPSSASSNQSFNGGRQRHPQEEREAQRRDRRRRSERDPRRRPSNATPRVRPRPEITIVDVQPMASHPAFADGSKGGFVPPEAPPSYEQAMRTSLPPNPTFTDPSVPDHLSEVRRIFPSFEQVTRTTAVSIPSYESSVTSQSVPRNITVTSSTPINTSSHHTVTSTVTSQGSPTPVPRQRSVNHNNNSGSRPSSSSTAGEVATPDSRLNLPSSRIPPLTPQSLPNEASTSSDCPPTRRKKPDLPPKRPALRPKPQVGPTNILNTATGTNVSNTIEQTRTQNVGTTQSRSKTALNQENTCNKPQTLATARNRANMSSSAQTADILDLVDQSPSSLHPPMLPSNNSTPEGSSSPAKGPGHVLPLMSSSAPNTIDLSMDSAPNDGSPSRAPPQLQHISPLRNPSVPQGSSSAPPGVPSTTSPPINTPPPHGGSLDGHYVHQEGSVPRPSNAASSFSSIDTEPRISGNTVDHDEVYPSLDQSKPPGFLSPQSRNLPPPPRPPCGPQQTAPQNSNSPMLKGSPMSPQMAPLSPHHAPMSVTFGPTDNNSPLSPIGSPPVKQFSSSTGQKSILDEMLTPIPASGPQPAPSVTSTQSPDLAFFHSMLLPTNPGPRPQMRHTPSTHSEVAPSLPKSGPTPQARAQQGIHSTVLTPTPAPGQTPQTNATTASSDAPKHPALHPVLFGPTTLQTGSPISILDTDTASVGVVPALLTPTAAPQPTPVPRKSNGVGNSPQGGDLSEPVYAAVARRRTSKAKLENDESPKVESFPPDLLEPTKGQIVSSELADSLLPPLPALRPPLEDFEDLLSPAEMDKAIKDRDAEDCRSTSGNVDDLFGLGIEITKTEQTKGGGDIEPAYESGDFIGRPPIQENTPPLPPPPQARRNLGRTSSTDSGSTGGIQPPPLPPSRTSGNSEHPGPRSNQSDHNEAMRNGNKEKDESLKKKIRRKSMRFKQTTAKMFRTQHKSVENAPNVHGKKGEQGGKMGSTTITEKPETQKSNSKPARPTGPPPARPSSTPRMSPNQKKPQRIPTSSPRNPPPRPPPPKLTPARPAPAPIRNLNQNNGVMNESPQPQVLSLITPNEEHQPTPKPRANSKNDPRNDSSQAQATMTPLRATPARSKAKPSRPPPIKPAPTSGQKSAPSKLLRAPPQVPAAKNEEKSSSQDGSSRPNRDPERKPTPRLRVQNNLRINKENSSHESITEVDGKTELKEGKRKEIGNTLKQKQFPVFAVYDFSGTSDEDLSFKSGDKITIIGEASDEWYRGKLGSKEGIFPKAFVQVAPQVDAAEDLQLVEAVMRKDAEDVAQSSLGSASPTWDEEPEVLADGPEVADPHVINAVHSSEASQSGEEKVFTPPKSVQSETSQMQSPTSSEQYQQENRDNDQSVKPTEKWTEPKSQLGVEVEAPPSNVSQSGDSANDSAVSVTTGMVRRSSTALFEFTGQDESELSFKRGDKVLVTGQVNDDWLTGEANGQQGMFPATFVTEVGNPGADEAGIASSSPKIANADDSSQPPPSGGFVEPMAKGVSDYRALSVDELSFKVDDALFLLEMVDSDWFMVQHEISGNVGKVPKSHVKVIHPLPEGGSSMSWHM